MTQADFERACQVAIELQWETTASIATAVGHSRYRKDLTIVELIAARKHAWQVVSGIDRMLAELEQPVSSREAARRCGEVGAALGEQR